MFSITKVYAKKVHAVNAIRMFVTNKGLAALSTDEAAAYVLPAADGFQVANGELNERYGFPVAEQEGATGQRVPAGAPTSGAALEVAAAIAATDKLHPKDAETIASRSAKLQTPSKVEQQKAAARELRESTAKVKSARKEVEPKAPVAKSVTQNGARRPAKPGKTLDVWLTAEAMHARNVEQKLADVVPTLKEVYAEILLQHPGFNKTTCSIQFYACRTFNGWTPAK